MNAKEFDGQTRIHTWSYMYWCADHALKWAQDFGSKEGCGGEVRYACMCSLAFSAFSIEALLNEIGIEYVEKWKDELERKLGIREKSLIVCDYTGMEKADKQEVFDAVREIFRIRNDMAHGKAFDARLVGVVEEDGLPEHQGPIWHEHSTVSRAKAILQKSWRVSELLIEANNNGPQPSWRYDRPPIITGSLQTAFGEVKDMRYRAILFKGRLLSERLSAEGGLPELAKEALAILPQFSDAVTSLIEGGDKPRYAVLLGNERCEAGSVVDGQFVPDEGAAE